MMTYSRQELKDMAQEALNARAKLDGRYLQLAMGLSVKLGMDPSQVVQRIEEMAAS